MSLRLGRLLGVPINVDVSWLVIFALIVYTLAQFYFPQANPSFSTAMNWLAGVIAALLLFASVLLHELMHSYVAKRNGIGISGITLFIFGGVSRMKEEPSTPEVELKMAAAGPATSIVLALLFWWLAVAGGRALLGSFGLGIVRYLAMINLILGIFNLLPGFPLDGGRVLRAILWGSLDSLDRATRYASYIGQGFGYLFILGGFWIMLFGGFLSGLWFVFIGWYLNNAAQQSYQQLVVRRALSGVDVHRVMTTDFPHVDPGISVDTFVHDYLLKYDYAAFPVTKDDALVGIITVDEIRDIPRDQWGERTVGQVAKAPEEERVIDENDDAFDALMHMAEGNLRRLLVMHNTKLQGMVTQDSIINMVRMKMQIGI
ncbi:MAG TPA: site-2 protease family protein [Armatimonadota bacterium]|nr:site-2 protease family protein [Armatimonadota bacterium]